MEKQDKKVRFALYVNQSALDLVDENFEKDNCLSKSEFIENAIRFYVSYLSSNTNIPYLSTVVMSTMEALLKENTNRLSKLLFKLAVELAITMNVVAANQGVDKEVLNSLRGECIKEVKKINGIFTFDEADNWQKGL
jgi:metal-responsive CopG/Arc/MetJ family transcriptional regulator